MLCAQVCRCDDGVRHLDAVGSPGQPWQLQPRSTKIQPKSTQDRPKIDQKSTPNRPRSVRNRAWMGPGGHLGSKVAPGADLTPKTDSLDPLGPPSWEPKSTKNRSKIDPKLSKFSDHFVDRFWSPLGADLVGFWAPKWSQNWSKIGFKSDQEANVKMLKNHWFLQCF